MNWTQLLNDLRAAKVSQQDIAAFCGDGTGQTTIADIAKGKTKNPSYKVGFAIIALHKKHCKKKLAV